MVPRLLIAVLVVDLTAVICAAAQGQAGATLTRQIDALSAFDYSTRMNAARMLRRAPAADVVPALLQAIRGHSDQFVRYRALILLTGFNYSGTGDLMRTLASDRNDRIREVAYRWFEHNPDPALTLSLLAALETEGAEFVRPALIRALAALPQDTDASRALLAEIGRGFDFFRSAVIEALGSHHAVYAVDAIGAVATTDGVLQDDAILALGRIGDQRALSTLASLEKPSPSVIPMVQAARCLLGDECPGRIEWLVTAARAPGARPDAIRAAVSAIGAIAERHAGARTALLDLAQTAVAPLRREVALALSAVALRHPAETIDWLGRASDAERLLALNLLRDGFESLEEDFAKEQFFAATRASYWKAAEASAGRTVAAAFIDKLDF